MRALDQLEAPLVPEFGVRRRLGGEECGDRSSGIELQAAQLGNNAALGNQ
jgi:hypothetical protein